MISLLSSCRGSFFLFFNQDFVAVKSGIHYDSELWMMFEADMRATVRCHGDAPPKETERAVEMEME